MQYLKHALPGATPQSEPIPGSTQERNRAGGYTWKIDPLTALRRFLILGTEGGSFYESERTLTREAADAVRVAIKEEGPKAVEVIAAVSVGGLAPKNDPAIFALALASTDEDPKTREAALRLVPKVCRTGTHLFTFCQFRDQLAGWGMKARRGVSAWYEDADPDALAYQMVKYRQRDGWTHRDVLRLAHPKAPTAEHAALYDWVTGREPHAEKLPSLIDAFRLAQAAPTPRVSADLISRYRLPREAIQPEHLNSTEVNEALLDAGMPMTALVRNLANLTRYGILATGSEWTRKVADTITDQDKLLKARIHPLALLTAMLTYSAGRGLRGSNEWTPVPAIIDALDEAFYLAFPNAPKIGRPTLVAVDESGSMTYGGVNGVPGLTPKLAAVALALVTVHQEDDVEVVAFETTIRTVALSRRQRLDDALRLFGGTPRGTDVSLPLQYAQAYNPRIEAFVVMTDGMTWAGRYHPAEAIKNYRKATGIPAVQATLAMVANQVSVSDPGDPGMLDFVGFDTATPGLVAEFVAGRL